MREVIILRGLPASGKTTWAEELYRKYIENQYNVIVWLDDRTSVVNHMRSLGLPVWQVASGDF